MQYHSRSQILLYTQIVLGVIGMIMGAVTLYGTVHMARLPPNTNTLAMAPGRFVLFQRGASLKAPLACHVVAKVLNNTRNSSGMLRVHTDGLTNASGCGGCMGVILKPGQSCSINVFPDLRRSGDFNSLITVEDGKTLLKTSILMQGIDIK